ncbi:exonuclease, partial [Streptococcus pneumoniae]|uniref:exonuclease domain-containing protein n=1 Tax=Streptococcus pneumoniae TaxID=1313 RepID=UPI0021E0494B
TNSFIALDDQTSNSFLGSLCTIVQVKIIDVQEVDSFYTLINPEEKFSSRNIKIHAIKPEDVIGAPTFPEVQKEIINFIDNLP